MSTKKAENIIVEDYSFTNKVIKISLEPDMTYKQVKDLIINELKLKKRRFSIFFGPKKGKNFQELSKKNISSLIDLIGKEELLLRVRRAVNLSKVRALRDLFVKDDVVLPVSVLKVDNVTQQETARRLQTIAKDFLEEIAENPKDAAFRIPARSSENVGYDDNSRMVLLGSHVVDRQFRHLSSVQSVVQLTGLMRYVNEILDAEKHA
ncbi:MAG: hypothetical protein ACW97X_14785 [Candidatus Hodarchaeales archaeon]|jgi:hypothetical protein